MQYFYPMMRKLIYVFILISLNSAYAQKNISAEDIPLKEKFFLGGNMGLQFGTYTYIEVAPLAGIHLKPNLDWAAGLMYTYLNNSITDYSSQMYGFNTYFQYTVFQPIVFHTQAEIINSDFFDTQGYIRRDWFDAVLVGGGLKQKIGVNSYSFLLILWNLNTSYNSPYQNPVIKVGVIF